MNQKKTPGKGRKITGIVFLVLGLISLLAYIVARDSYNGETLAGSIMFILIGIILMFAKLRGYGWLIGVTAFLCVAFANVLESDFGSSFVSSLVLAAACLVVLVGINIRRKKQ